MNLGKQTGAVYKAPRPLTSAQMRELASNALKEQAQPVLAPVAEQPVPVTV